MNQLASKFVTVLLLILFAGCGVEESNKLTKDQVSTVLVGNWKIKTLPGTASMLKFPSSFREENTILSINSDGKVIAQSIPVFLNDYQTELISGQGHWQLTKSLYGQSNVPFDVEIYIDNYSNALRLSIEGVDTKMILKDVANVNEGDYISYHKVSNQRGD